MIKRELNYLGMDFVTLDDQLMAKETFDYWKRDFDAKNNCKTSKKNPEMLEYVYNSVTVEELDT